MIEYGMMYEIIVFNDDSIKIKMKRLSVKEQAVE